LEEKEIEGATVTAVTSDCSLAWSRRAISSTLLATIPVNNYNTMFSIPLHECYFKPRIYMWNLQAPNAGGQTEETFGSLPHTPSMCFLKFRPCQFAIFWDMDWPTFVYVVVLSIFLQK
jgi:hypothetical protein